MRVLCSIGLLAAATAAFAGCGGSGHSSATAHTGATTTTAAPATGWCDGLTMYRSLQSEVQASKDTYGTISLKARAINAQWALASNATGDPRYATAATDAATISNDALNVDFSGDPSHDHRPEMLTADFTRTNADIAALPDC